MTLSIPGPRVKGLVAFFARQDDAGRIGGRSIHTVGDRQKKNPLSVCCMCVWPDSCAWRTPPPLKTRAPPPPPTTTRQFPFERALSPLPHLFLFTRFQARKWAARVVSLASPLPPLLLLFFFLLLCSWLWHVVNVRRGIDVAIVDRLLAAFCPPHPALSLKRFSALFYCLSVHCRFSLPSPSLVKNHVRRRWYVFLCADTKIWLPLSFCGPV